MKMNRSFARCAVKPLWLILFSATAAFGQGTFLWDEAVNGQISNYPNAPTFIGFMQVGTNSLIGTAHFVPTGGGPGGTLYSDFVTFTINDGLSVLEIMFTTDVRVAVWIGDEGFSQELASVINPVNGQLLPQLGLSSIPSGTYGFYVPNQQFGGSSSAANYRVDFFVQPVPEPSVFSLWLVGAGFVGWRCWRNDRFQWAQ